MVDEKAIIENLNKIKLKTIKEQADVLKHNINWIKEAAEKGDVTNVMLYLVKIQGIHKRIKDEYFKTGIQKW